jgi:hypothetical protein
MARSILIRLPETLADRLTRQARRDGVSRTAHIARLLGEGSDRHERETTMTTKTTDTARAMADQGWDEELAVYAAERAATYREQGWQGDGADYDLGAYPGDEEQWSECIGHDLCHDERNQLERAIRHALDLTA